MSTEDEEVIYRLFLILKEAGIPVGLAEYRLLMTAFKDGFCELNASSLFNICQLLWVKDPSASILLERCIREAFSCYKQLPPHSYKRTKKRSQLIQLILTPVVIALLLFYTELNVFFTETLTSSRQVRNEELVDPFPAEVSISRENLSSEDGFSEERSVSTPSEEALIPSVAHTDKSLYFVNALVVSALLFSQKERINIGLSSILISIQSRLKLILRKSYSTDGLSRSHMRRLTSNSYSGRANICNERVYSAESYCTAIVPKEKLEKIWRSLSSKNRKVNKAEVSIRKTLRKLGRQGFILCPEFNSAYNHLSQVTFLVDRERSMQSFHILIDYLTKSAQQSKQIKQVEIYYFTNVPDKWLYKDKFFQVAVPEHDVMARIRNAPRSGIIIVSDGGAVKGSFNRARIEKTGAFLSRLSSATRCSAWINPMPSTRWKGTSAASISRRINMYEFSEPGLQSMVSVLRRDA